MGVFQGKRPLRTASPVFQSTISGHFVQKKKSRDADIQLTRELILRVGNVHILLVLTGNLLFLSS
jgi:hypothetical protein